MDRRTFIVSAAAIVPGCASLATTAVTPVSGRVSLRLSEYPELNRSGGVLRVRPGSDDTVLYVLALGESSFATVSPICQHRGCTVEVAGEILECPCHGSRYDRRGAVLRGPTQFPLQRYTTSVSPEGVVTIDLREAR